MSDGDPETQATEESSGWVDVGLTSADYRAFERTAAKGPLVALILMLAVVMLAALVLVVTEPGPASIVALIWLFGVVLFVGLRRRAAGRRAAEEASGRVRLSDSAFEYQSGRSRGSVDWSAVSGVLETRDHIFVFTGKKRGWIVPKRCLSSQDAASAFAQRARRLIDAGHALEILEPEA